MSGEVDTDRKRAEIIAQKVTDGLNGKNKKPTRSAMDVVVATMEEVEKTKEVGSSKSALARSVFELVLQLGGSFLPAEVLSQARTILNSGVLEDAFTVISDASKNLFGINLKKKMASCNCLGM